MMTLYTLQMADLKTRKKKSFFYTTESMLRRNTRASAYQLQQMLINDKMYAVILCHV